jgi:hypothetical protein
MADQQGDIDIVTTPATENIPTTQENPLPYIGSKRQAEDDVAVNNLLYPKKIKRSDVEKTIRRILNQTYDPIIYNPTVTPEQIKTYIDGVLTSLPSHKELNAFTQDQLREVITRHGDEFRGILKDKFERANAPSINKVAIELCAEFSSVGVYNTFLLQNLFHDLPQPYIFDTDIYSLANHIPICSKYLEVVGARRLYAMFIGSSLNYIEIPFENIVDCLRIGLGYVNVQEYLEYLYNCVNSFLNAFVYLHTGVIWFFKDLTDKDAFITFIINMYLVGYASSIYTSFLDIYKSETGVDLASPHIVTVDEFDKFKSTTRRMHNTIHYKLRNKLSSIRSFHGIKSSNATNERCQ